MSPGGFPCPHGPLPFRRCCQSGMGLGHQAFRKPEWLLSGCWLMGEDRRVGLKPKERWAIRTD